MHRKRKIALIMAAVLVIAGVGIYGGKSILKKSSSKQSQKTQTSESKGENSGEFSKQQYITGWGHYIRWN